MRFVLVAAGFIALVPQSALADDAEAIVEKAVRAMANSDLRLNRLATVVRVERGAFYPPVGEIPTRRTAYLSPPDHIKYDAELTRGGQKGAMILAVNGVSGWKIDGAAPQELLREEKEGLEGDLSTWALVTLLPVRQKGTTVKALPAKTVNGTKAVGVAVKRPDRPDAQIYFSADTGLPLKVTVETKGANRDWDLAEYRDFDGIKLPTRITVTQNGRKIEDWTVQSVRFPDRLDDKAFQKPK